MEWNDPATGGLPACDGCVIRDGTISSCVIGIDMDEGTARTSVQRVRFLSQTIAAIVDYLGIGNSYGSNDYAGIAPAAVPVSTSAPPNDVFTCR
ncbi:MAG: hypothetical protein AABM40_15450, partial [Chloroflexota bacterium]